MFTPYLLDNCFREENIIRKPEIVNVPFNEEVSDRIPSSFSFPLKKACELFKRVNMF